MKGRKKDRKKERKKETKKERKKERLFPKKNLPPWSLQKGTRPKCEDRWQQEACPRTDKGTCEPRFKILFSISFKMTVNNR